MTIAEKWLQQGFEQGLERGLQEGLQKARQETMVIGGILFAQRMMKLPIYDRAELERKDLNELNAILAKMEARIKTERDIQK